MKYLNHERYIDYTAGKAIENVMREEKKEKYRQHRARAEPETMFGYLIGELESFKQVCKQLGYKIR